MRKILLYLATFLLFFTFYGFLSPGTAEAKPDKPTGLFASGSCVSGEELVTFSWDTDGYPNMEYEDVNWNIEIENFLNPKPVNNISDVPYVYNATDDPDDITYRWRVSAHDKFPCVVNCDTDSDWEYVEKVECPFQEEEETLGAGDCKVTVTALEGEDEDNPELIKITIDPVDQNIADSGNPYYEGPGDKGYNVYIGQTFVKGKAGDIFTDDNKFEIRNYPTETDYKWGKSQLINANGVVELPSVNRAYRVSNEGNGAWDNKTYSVTLQQHRDAPGIDPPGVVCTGSFTIGNPDFNKCTKDEDCFSGDCNESTGDCRRGITTIACNFVNTSENAKGEITDTEYICNTAIGPFSADVEGFSKSVLRLVLGLAGGLLLILIMINGYKFMTSQGDPEKIKDAREGIIAAIAGILLIIFSLSLLQLLTVDILRIPGFSP